MTRIAAGQPPNLKFASLAVAAVFACATAAGAAEPKYRQLSAAQIRASVVGNAITDDAHWSDYFHADGKLESYDLGKLRPGSWKLDGDQLCLTRAGRGGGTDCFEIWAARDAVQYRRDGVVVADGFLREIPKRRK